MGNDPERERLDELQARIRAAGKDPGEKSRNGAAMSSEAGAAESAKASRTGYEFVGTVLACTGFGWLLDRWAGTSPWGIPGMLFVGFMVGAFNVWRTLNGYDQSVGLHKRDKE